MAKRETVSTLGDLRDYGMGLFANCTAQFAGHGSQLNLDELIEKYGEDYVFINETRIARACKCWCGHKGAKITMVANTTPQMVRNGDAI